MSSYRYFVLLAGMFLASLSRAEPDPRPLVRLEGFVNVHEGNPLPALFGQGKGGTAKIIGVTLFTPAELMCRYVTILCSDLDRPRWQTAEEQVVSFELDAAVFERLKAAKQADALGNMLSTAVVKNVQVRPDPPPEKSGRTP